MIMDLNGKKLVIASHNEGKIKEIRNLLNPYGVDVVSAAELQLPDVEETGTTFEENAVLKAESLAKLSGLPCLADDSGLCVEALGGRPGVYTARYAPNRDFGKGMDKLLAELSGVESQERAAFFNCVLALSLPEGKTQTFSGKVCGRIAYEKCGDGGFGFDPLFIPDEGDGRTFAQMAQSEKDKISHRGRALEKFVKEIFAN